jgi:uncharacterized protein
VGVNCGENIWKELKMVKFTQDMKDIATRQSVFILATASKEGKPNAVPIGLGKIISDDEIMLVNTLMRKSLLNIAENPRAAITFWSMDVHYGYQFKGKAREETSGKNFDGAVEWFKTRFPHSQARSVIIVKVEEVYYIGRGKDSSKNLCD